MTTQLTAMWQTIAEAYPYAEMAIQPSNRTPDGMPHTPTNGPKSPVNDTALSWCDLTQRVAAHWGHTIHTLGPELTNLWNNLGPDDQLRLQTDIHTIHNGCKQWLPAHTQTTRLTAEQIAGIHCATIQEIAWALNSLGLPTKLNTIKSWAHRGHLTKTPHGYPLTQAHTLRVHLT